MKTERKGYQKAVLVIAVFTILAGALYATDKFSENSAKQIRKQYIKTE